MALYIYDLNILILSTCMKIIYIYKVNKKKVG